MTRSNVLAALLYRKAVELKSQNYRKLYWKKNRDNLIKSLSAMQFLTHCIGMDSISVHRYIFGFHNLPRAFLSLSDKMKISPTDAWNYSKPYLKFD